jgi:tetratricopeptide (TPR) repeat protein
VGDLFTAAVFPGLMLGFVYLAYILGLSYANQKDFTNAINSYNKAISLKAEYPEAFFVRGVAYKTQKKYIRAILDFQDVIRMDNDPILVQQAKVHINDIERKY